MALKAILDSLDGLSADVAKEYKKGDDGKFRLDVTEVNGFALEDVAGLRSSLSKERENVRTLKEQSKTFEGLDPAKARDAIKKVEEMANWTPEQKVKEQIEAVKTQLLDAHGKEKRALEDRQSKLTKQLEESMIRSVATQAIVELKGTKDAPMVMMPHIERQTRLRETDGKYIVEVIGQDGNPRLTGSQGTAMTIAQLVDEMKTQDAWAFCFEGKNAKGGGSSSNGGKTGGVDLSKLTPVERLKLARQQKT